MTVFIFSMINTIRSARVAVPHRDEIDVSVDRMYLGTGVLAKHGRSRLMLREQFDETAFNAKTALRWMKLHAEISRYARARRRSACWRYLVPEANV
jgi:hypothetical protein